MNIQIFLNSLLIFHHRQAFPSFSFIIDLALTLPISTARAECCFSIVKKVLAPQRLSMDFERKSHLVL